MQSCGACPVGYIYTAIPLASEAGPLTDPGAHCLTRLASPLQMTDPPVSVLQSLQALTLCISKYLNFGLHGSTANMLPFATQHHHMRPMGCFKIKENLHNFAIVK